MTGGVARIVGLGAGFLLDYKRFCSLSLPDYITFFVGSLLAETEAERPVVP